MKTNLKPSHVLKIESLRKHPFCGMLGCAENEQLARHLVEFLAKETDEWNVPLPDDVFDSLAEKDWLLDHHHPDGTWCQFYADFTNLKKLNWEFVKAVTRYDDGTEFDDDILKRLIPEWPCDNG